MVSIGCELEFWILMSGVAVALIFSVACFRMINTIKHHVLQFKPPQFEHQVSVIVKDENKWPEGDISRKP